MRNKKFFNQRFVPCFNEIYSKAVCCTPLNPDIKITYDWVLNHAPQYLEHGNRGLRVLFPYECFYLDGDELKKSVNNYTKGLRGTWYYPYKFGSMDEEGWKERDEKHSKILYAFRDFEAEVSKDKSLTAAQRRAKIKKRALQDGFEWRVYDAESLSFSIYLGPSPCSNKETVDTMGHVYEIIKPTLDTCVKKVYKSYKENLTEENKNDDWAIKALKYEEAQTFNALVEAVMEKHFNEIQQKFNMDKWRVKDYITHTCALWICLNY